MKRINKKDGIRTYSSDSDLVTLKRDEIIARATKVFVKKGYHQTSMRELANGIGMSIGSIYHYVGSKQDILYLIINTAVNRPEQWKDNITASLNAADATQVLKAFIEAYYTMADQAHNITLFTYQETRNLDRKWQELIREAASKDVDVCAMIMQKGVESGEFKIDNVPLMAHNVIVLGHLWAVRWWHLSKICTLDEYIKEETDLILGRIANRSTPQASKTAR
jgi:TetR/AcrR family transcriptional regulator, cholesterol catabolism regulator